MLPVITDAIISVYDQTRHADSLVSSCCVQPCLAWMIVSILIQGETSRLHTGADHKYLGLFIKGLELPLATLRLIALDGTTGKRDISTMRPAVPSILLSALQLLEDDHVPFPDAISTLDNLKHARATASLSLEVKR